MQSLKILVTGANGLVGSYVIAELLQQNYTVSAFIRKNSDLNLIQPYLNSIDLIEGDILDSQLLKTEIAKVDAVIHCAAIVSYAPHRFNEMYQTNVEGTRNVVNEALLAQIKLIHISSVAALGQNTGTIIDESALWNDSETTTYYAKTKYLAELEVWRGIEEGLKTVILNPSVILGNGDLEKSSTKIFSYVKNGGKFFTEGKVNYIDVKDVAKIAVGALLNENALNNRFVLNAGSITYKQLFEKIATHYHVKPPKIRVNKTIASLAWRVEYIKYLITGKEPLITKETTRISQKTKIYDNSKAINTFGVKYKNIDEIISTINEKKQ